MKPVEILTEFAEQENITALIKDDEISKMGKEAVRGFQEDYASIAEWRQEVEAIREVASQKAEPKTYPWKDASNVKYPLILNAAQQFNARAYPAIINSGNIVLGKVIGNDDGVPEVDASGQPIVDDNGEIMFKVPPLAKRARADRVSKHMSYQLTEEMEEWDEDMDALLAMLPNDGCEFKKVYFDSSRGRNVAEFIQALDLVVNQDTECLATCPRISHIFPLYPHEVIERVNGDIFRKVPFMDKFETSDTEPLEFIEQHTLYDLDEDGYPEPYIVTFERDGGEVVRVAANFGVRDIESNDKGEIVKITPRRYFVKYACFPDPKGGFYGKGFGQLLKPINDSVDSILNQLIDAGHLSNTGGGFLAKGFRIKSGELRFSPGEWKKVDVGGGLLKDSILPLPIKEPSNVLFLLLGLLIDAGKDIASNQDVMTGGGGENTPATTVLAMIEQGMKVYSAIFKRIYRSLREELKILYRLNGEYLPEEVYVNILDEPLAVARSDYEAEGVDIAPAADPTMATDVQKAAKSQILLQYAEWPEANRAAIMRKTLIDAGFTDAEDYINPPQEGPTPEQLQELAKLNIEKGKLDLSRWQAIVKNMDTLANALKKIAEADDLGADNLTNVKELIIATQEAMNGQGNLQPGGLPGMEGTQPMVLGPPANGAGPAPGNAGRPAGDGALLPPNAGRGHAPRRCRD